MKNRNVEHERVNDILLGFIERPLLKWFAAKMPNSLTPDVLTSIGVLGGVIVGCGYILTQMHPGFLWLASAGFLINWFGDSLDGTVARHRKIERPKFGYFIDHTVDAFTQLIIALGIGLSPYVELSIALYALAGYLLVSIHSYILIFVRGFFKISYGRFGPTEARAIAVFLNTAVFFAGNPRLDLGLVQLSFLDLVFLLLGTLLLMIYILATAHQAKHIATLDK